jgi:hypothetical protein
MWPWLYVESFLLISLGGLSIWGATLTFGNFDKVGPGPDECRPWLFIVAFTSVVLIFSIFAEMLVRDVYIVAVRIQKEKKRSEETISSEDQDDETPASS